MPVGPTLRPKLTFVTPTTLVFLYVSKVTWVNSMDSRFYSAHLVDSSPTEIPEYMGIPARDLGVMVHAFISILGKVRREDCEFEVSLSYLSRPQEKKKKNKKSHILISSRLSQ